MVVNWFTTEGMVDYCFRMVDPWVVMMNVCNSLLVMHSSCQIQLLIAGWQLKLPTVVISIYCTHHDSPCLNLVTQWYCFWIIQHYHLSYTPSMSPTMTWKAYPLDPLLTNTAHCLTIVYHWLTSCTIIINRLPTISVSCWSLTILKPPWLTIAKASIELHY